MAIGDTTVSGGYRIGDTTAIKNHIEGNFTISGSQLFVIQDAGNQKVYIGITEGGGA